MLSPRGQIPPFRVPAKKCQTKKAAANFMAQAFNQYTFPHHAGGTRKNNSCFHHNNFRFQRYTDGVAIIILCIGLLGEPFNSCAPLSLGKGRIPAKSRLVVL